MGVVTVASLSKVNNTHPPKSTLLLFGYDMSHGLFLDLYAIGSTARMNNLSAANIAFV
jgi:hypothetical protein